MCALKVTWDSALQAVDRDCVFCDQNAGRRPGSHGPISVFQILQEQLLWSFKTNKSTVLALYHHNILD